MKLLTFNSDVTVSLGKKNVMMVELPDNLKDEDIVRLFRMHKSRQFISIGDPQVSMEDLGVNADRPGMPYNVQSDGTVESVGEQGDIFDSQNAGEGLNLEDSELDDSLEPTNASDASETPLFDSESESESEEVEAKDEIEKWILNGNAFGDEELDWETLLRRKKSGESWMQIAGSLGLNSREMSIAWTAYKKRVKEYLSGEEHGAA